MNNASMYPLERLVAIRNERVSGDKNPDWPYIGLEHLAQGEPTLLGTLPSSASVSINSVFYPNDILFGKLRPNLQKSLQVWFPGYCSTDIIVFQTAKGIYSGFAAKIFQWSRTFDAAVKSTEGTKMPRTSWHNLRHLEVFVPSLPEQRAIAAVLDTVDAAVQRAEQLIAKLKLMKAGLLHDLLTRGIDAEGNLRDPVAHPEQFKETTFGRFPREWQMCRLSERANVGYGVALGRKLGEFGTVELPYLRVANVQDGFLDLSEIKTLRIPVEEVSKFLLQEGDVLLTEGGDPDKLGRGTVWHSEITPCIHQNHIFRVRVDKTQLNPAFLSVIAGSAYGKNYFWNSSKQSTNLASINSTQLNNFPLPCPSLLEQNAIVDIVESQNTRLNIEQAARDKLKLLKSGLMDDLLTGRVRVGDLKVDLP